MRVPLEGISDLIKLIRFDSSINEASVEFGLASGFANDFFAEISMRAL
jgi:hypothetical protein